jgi:flagellar biosynthesis chaperone FliJ
MGRFGAVLRGLRRLLQLRQLEEDQSRVALESALAELHRLEQALTTAGERGRRSRQLVHLAVRTDEMCDRIAGLEEGRAALRLAAMLEEAIPRARQTADVLRSNYQSARVERRQVETLLREAEAAEALNAGRRSQQALDDRYGSRLQFAEAAAGRARSRLDGKKLEDELSGSS